MGTRSLTIFKAASEDSEVELAVLYRQFDGYPTGLGRDILDCFKGKTVVNGYSNDNQINGPGDMAVQLIAFLKQKSAYRFDFDKEQYVQKPVNTPGGLYLHPPETRDCGEEYIYTLTCPESHGPDHHRWEGRLGLRVETAYGGSEVLYDGPLDEFDPDRAEASDADEEEGQ